MRGATASDNVRPVQPYNFNPRTPCGVRRGAIMAYYNPYIFQSTHPVRGATTYLQNQSYNHILQFQSTHPVRGATIALIYDFSSATISIHAPRAGCDADCRLLDSSYRISIHAPRAGCDALVGAHLFQQFISIHAPRAGCDVTVQLAHLDFYNFNPRTPCGVRHRVIHHATPNAEFQSTHPVRGATAIPSSTKPTLLNFNPRTPCGVRPSATCSHAYFFLFQSTHPVRGATAYCLTTSALSLFQSTHPVRGATKLHKHIRKIIRFQSTHPVRGATGS